MTLHRSALVFAVGALVVVVVIIIVGCVIAIIRQNRRDRCST